MNRPNHYPFWKRWQERQNRLYVGDLSQTGYTTIPLMAGMLPYRDRKFKYVRPIPRGLEGHVSIQTYWVDKDNRDRLFMRFLVSDDVMVFVAIEPVNKKVPEWLRGWHREEGILRTSGIVPNRVIFSAPFRRGYVYLGGNSSDAYGKARPRSMYNVIVMPLWLYNANLVTNEDPQ